MKLKSSSIAESMFNGTLMVMIFSALTTLIGMMVDGVIIGNFLGEQAMAAYGLAGPVFVVIAALGGVFSSGMQTACAKSLGNGDLNGANRKFSAMFLIALITGVVCMAALLVFSGPIAVFLGASGESASLYEPTSKYIAGLAMGIPGTLVMLLLTPVMQLDNDRGRTMRATVIMTTVNIIGDVLVAFVLPLGMFGMAIFTSVSYYVAAVILLLHFRRGKASFRIRLTDTDMKAIPSMLWTGLPTAVNRVCHTARSMCLNKLLLVIAASGAVTAFSVQSNMVSLFGSVGNGIGLATLMLSGLFFGEKDKSSLKQLFHAGLKKILFLVCPLALLLIVFAPFFVDLYAAGFSSDIREMAVHSVRWYAVSLPLYAINIIFMNYLQGTQKLVLANVICILNNFLLVTAAAYLLGGAIGAEGVWIAFPIGELLTLLALFVLAFSHEKKLPIATENYLFLDKSFEVSAAQKLEFAVNSMEQVVDASVQVGGFCRSHNLSDRNVYLLSLYVEEMAGNIIEHGFADGKKHRMDVRLVIKENEIVLRFRDDCRPFDPKKQMEMLNPEDPASNIGIRMVVKSADSVEYVNTMKMNNLIIRMKVLSA